MGQSSREIIAFAVVFPFLAAVAVSLRFWSRKKTGQGLDWDDYLVFSALLLLICFDAVPMAISEFLASEAEKHAESVTVAVDDNLGNHQQFFHGRPVKSTYRNNICQYILDSLGFLPIAFAKISMLWLYKRIFRGAIFIAVTWAMIAVVIVWGATIFFGNIFQCTPISKYLHSSHDPSLHCVNSLQMYYAHSISDVCIDFVIMIMPWPTIWKLQMSTHRKIAVTVVLILGCLTIAASAAKTAEFYIAGNHISAGSEDITYIVAPTVYYTEIEASLGIVTVSVPCLRPLFRGMSPESIIASVRSMISLHSAHSDSNKGSQRTNRVKTSSPSSSIEQLHVKQPLPPMPVYMGQSEHETIVFQAKDNFPSESIGRLPKDRIAVQKTWQTSLDAV